MDENKENNAFESERFELNLYENRLKTFNNMWPFTNDCLCTPENMANAGFYFCGGDSEPDLVQCYVCRKELDGWEPNDDPLKEHKSHSKNCPFLKFPKELTVWDYLKLEEQRQKYKIEKGANSLLEDFKKHASQGRKELEKLAD